MQLSEVQRPSTRRLLRDLGVEDVDNALHALEGVARHVYAAELCERLARSAWEALPAGQRRSRVAKLERAVDSFRATLDELYPEVIFFLDAHAVFDTLDEAKARLRKLKRTAKGPDLDLGRRRAVAGAVHVVRSNGGAVDVTRNGPLARIVRAVYKLATERELPADLRELMDYASEVAQIPDLEGYLWTPPAVRRGRGK